MTKIDRYEVEDRMTTIDDERKRALDLYSLRLPVPSVGIFDEPTRCYKINKQWAAIVMGMVSWLTEIAPWYQAENEDYEPIQQISLFLEGSDCVSFALRQKPDNGCILQQTLDGEIWTDVFDFSLCSTIQDASYVIANQNNYTYSFENIFENVYNEYTTNYVSSPVDVHPQLDYGTSDPDDLDAAYCNAVYSLVVAACDAAIQYYRDQDEEQANINVGLAIGAIILTAIAVAGALPTAGASLAGLGALAGAWATVIGLTAPLGNALVDAWQTHNIEKFQDDAAREAVVCYIVENLPGDENTYATMSGLLDSHTLTGNAAAIAQTLNLMLDHDSTYAAFLEKWQNNLDYAEAGIALYCPCDDGVWCKRFDFTIDDQNWHPWETDDREFGQHLGGIGYGCTLDTLESITANRCYIENTESLAPYTLTNIKIGYIGTAGASPRFIACQGELEGEFVFDHGFGEWFTDGIEHELEFSLDEIIDKPRVYAGSGGTLVADPDSIVFTFIELSGTGTNPYGEDNCE